MKGKCQHKGSAQFRSPHQPMQSTYMYFTEVDRFSAMSYKARQLRSLSFKLQKFIRTNVRLDTYKLIAQKNRRSL
jgi:hypothetical protein